MFKMNKGKQVRKLQTLCATKLTKHTKSLLNHTQCQVDSCKRKNTPEGLPPCSQQDEGTQRETVCCQVLFSD